MLCIVNVLMLREKQLIINPCSSFCEMEAWAPGYGHIYEIVHLVVLFPPYLLPPGLSDPIIRRGHKKGEDERGGGPKDYYTPSFFFCVNRLTGGYK